MAEPETDQAPEQQADERKLLDFLNEVDDDAKAFRAETRFDENAERWLKIRNGEALAPPERPGTAPVFAANLLGNYIERKVAAITESQPSMLVSAVNPQLGAPAVVLDDTVKAVLAMNGFQSRCESAADMAATFGWVPFQTVWDPAADYGAGAIVVQPVDPRRVFIDRHVTDAADIDQAQYVIIDTPMPLDEVRRIWPGRGKLVQPDEGLTNRHGATRPPNTLYLDGKRSARSPETIEGPYEWVVIREYQLASPLLGDTAQDLFPAGRRIIRPRDQAIVLEDGPNPYWDGLWSIDVWDWRPNGFTYMGRSDVEEGRKIQESYNRLGNSIVTNIILSAVISVVADSNALTPEDWKRLDSRALRIIKKNPGREFNLMPPPPMPAEYLQAMGQLERTLQTILGVPDSMQGNRQAGVVAASAVEGLMTQAEKLSRATARRLEYTVERIGQKLISRVIQFYTSDRVLLTHGPDQAWQSYTFMRKQFLDMALTPLSPDGAFQAESDRLDTLRSLWAQFRFKVTPLSAMPGSKIQRTLLAMNLYQAGLIDDEEVLRIAEWPSGQAVLQRTRQKQATGQLPIPGQDGKGGAGRPNRRGTSLSLG